MGGEEEGMARGCTLGKVGNNGAMGLGEQSGMVGLGFGDGL